MRRQLLVNGALLALALGTLGVIWTTREAPTTSELQARKDKLLASFRRDAISRLVLSQGDRELQLDADAAGEFRIVKPWPERADVATVSQLLGSLDLASALRPADGVSDALAGFTAQALVIRLEMPGKSQTLRLGGPAPSPTGARYAEVQSEGTKKRYVVSQGVATELALPFEKFREPRLLEYGRSELAKIEVIQPLDRVELSQGEHGAFFVQLPRGRELANRDSVERVLNALSRLVTEHFVEAEDARKALGNPPLRLTLTLTDKALTPVTLAFGPCPDSPSESLVLKEQPGKGARAGCVPQELVSALTLTRDLMSLPGPFAARPDEVEELRISRGAQKLELARKDKGFVLRAPSQADVPLDAGNARIAAIVGARGVRVSNANLASLGLEPAAGELSIQVTGADEAAHRTEQVLLGKPRSDGSVCLKRSADGVALCFGAETARAFEPDATLLKGLTPFSFAPSELASFSVETATLREAVRRSEDGGYQLEEPKGFKHDGALVADAVQTLGTLQAVRWVPPADDTSFGLQPPRVHIAISLVAGGRTLALDLGAATAGGFFARASTDPGVFVLPRSVVQTLSEPLIERSLVPVPEAELTGLVLESGGRKLSANRSPGSGPTDPSNQADSWQGTLKSATVEAILSLKAEQTLHLGAAKPGEGLAKPTLVLHFSAKDGQQFRLLVGANDTIDDTPIAYTRLEGVDATFALSARTATLLRDSTDP